MNIKIEDNSQAVLAAFEQKVKTALMAIGETAVSYAMLDCPVDTGRLQNSITHETIDEDVYIGTNVEYAPVQEYKHHYLKNAAANHKGEYKTIMEAALKD